LQVQSQQPVERHLLVKIKFKKLKSGLYI